MTFTSSKSYAPALFTTHLWYHVPAICPADPVLLARKVSGIPEKYGIGQKGVNNADIHHYYRPLSCMNFWNKQDDNIVIFRENRIFGGKK